MSMKQKQNSIINEALAVARMYWGYSQKELAEIMGVSQSMISEIENGTKSVTLDMLENYSRALRVRRSQLLFFSEEIEGHRPLRSGRLLIAEKALHLLKKIKPSEKNNEHSKE